MANVQRELQERLFRCYYWCATSKHDTFSAIARERCLVRAHPLLPTAPLTDSNPHRCALCECVVPTTASFGVVLPADADTIVALHWANERKLVSAGWDGHVRFHDVNLLNYTSNLVVEAPFGAPVLACAPGVS